MIYKIKKGYHYSDNLIHKLLSFFHGSDKQSFYVLFNESSIYNEQSIDKFDINKLFGFSLGLHHKNSHRFGWNCLDNKIHIYAYSYVDSKRLTNEICTIDINKVYKFIIRIKGDKCIFTIIDSDYKINQTVMPNTSKKCFGYTLWPYFGGNKTAPQNIFIDLEENN